MVAADPGLPARSIHAAAVLGDEARVRALLAKHPGAVTATAEPFGGMPLVYLCLSKFLRLERERSDAFVRTATLLLDAGADPNGGFWTTGEFPEFETPLYGAAGVAHHAPLTKLLLERGADPNDGEVTYHSPESHDLEAMRLVVETGRLTPASLAVMLIRKHDWHDLEGVRYLLRQGANPNERWGRPGFTAMHHAIMRDNAREAMEALLDHGGDPRLEQEGLSAVARAARRGRGDLLRLFQARGFPIELTGVDRLIAACALDDDAGVARAVAEAPALVAQLRAMGGALLAGFAGTANTAGVARLLDLGIPVDARYAGDGYWDLAQDTTALHVAAWRAWHDTLRLLLARGAPVNAVDARHRTPLMLAVRACVDSYWTERRSPEGVAALLAAGATTDGITLPTGYAEIDSLLEAHRATR